MGAKILYRDSRGRDGSVDLEPTTPCYVGRALDCAIRTDDAMVSRKHSMIRMESGSFYVEDLGSSNGTQVNNQRISKQRLNHNDVVRCGSLWLRYIEEGPIAGSQPYPQAAQPGGYGAQAQPAGGLGRGPSGFGPARPGGPPAMHGAGSPGMGPPAIPGASPGGFGGQPRKGGTQRLDAPGSPAKGPSPVARPSPPQPASGFSPQYGSPPVIPAQSPPSPPSPAVASGFGSPPAMPSDSPYGSPPAMPDVGGIIGAEATEAQQNPFDRPDEPSVVVDMGNEVSARGKHELHDARAKLDDLQAQFDREVADGKRLRAEAQTLRDRIDDLNETIKDRDEQVRAHSRVAEELREELKQSKAELAGARENLSELAGEVQSRDRQIGRTQDDIGKLKDDIEELSRQLAEVSKTKDEGWKKLNEQLSEIEHLREVINEQERMLEERRIGLISQEEVIKELRANKEKQIKSLAQLKAERDEVAGNYNRMQAQMQAIDEENRRLSRLLVDMQKGGVGSDTTATLAEELKHARVEVKKIESDRDRYQDMYERADKAVQALEERVAHLEVELRDAMDKHATASSSQSVIGDSLAKAEVARARAAEEALDAARARDEAVAEAEKARREADRLRRRVETLQTSIGSGNADRAAELETENEALERRLKVAQDRATDLERSVRSLEAEVAAAKVDVKVAKTGAFVIDPAVAAAAAGETIPGSSPDSSAESPGGGVADEIKEKAMEVYEDVNDILSEIRNNIRLIQGEFSDMARESNDDSVRIISDTIQTLIDSAEDAKGIIRSLRELAEFS